MRTEANEKYLKLLSELAVSDLLGVRPCERLDNRAIDKLASQVAQQTAEKRFVYTAFDGDHQMFCSLMRAFVVSYGKTPINPDSVLGYKETLSFRQNKRDVLLDDLSVLRGCHEIWIFTERSAALEEISGFAEGVLVELLYFLKRHPKQPVKFVNLSELPCGLTKESIVDWDFGYEETVSYLNDDQREEVLALANSGMTIDRELRNIRYYLHDPLDYKYSRFVRSEGYRRNEVPLLPYLAARVEDNGNRKVALATTIIGWAHLMNLASACTKLPPLDTVRGTSQIVDLLERVWLRRAGAHQPEEGDWSNFKVPKASQKSNWAITERERSQYGKR